jgi:hypothetical protein
MTKCQKPGSAPEKGSERSQWLEAALAMSETHLYCLEGCSDYFK